MEKEFHTIVEFDKSQICLELPKEIVADGWEFESTVNPAEVSVERLCDTSCNVFI